jgi:hypothetical protein
MPRHKIPGWIVIIKQHETGDIIGVSESLSLQGGIGNQRSGVTEDRSQSQGVKKAKARRRRRLGDLVVWLALMAASGKPPLRGALVAHLKECGSNDGMLERLSHMLCSEIAYAEDKIRSFSGEMILHPSPEAGWQCPSNPQAVVCTS